MNPIQISVVIPTFNRRTSLMQVLGCLNKSTYPISEVIIVDASDEKLSAEAYEPFDRLKIKYLVTMPSVCLQRNVGIKEAGSEWIWLCDDDIDVPPNYIEKLVHHISSHPEAGAVSGLVFEEAHGKWVAQYQIKSAAMLIWRYIFQLHVWGELKVNLRNPIARRIIADYKQKGNHLSKAGWPVITDFSGEYFTSPIYGLGASLVRKSWLTSSPYDENLTRNGIGDNYGVALGFPDQIHVLKGTSVLHRKESGNRLSDSHQYKERILSLHYFMQTRRQFSFANRLWFYWSLIGNTLYYMMRLHPRAFSSLNTLFTCSLGLNPILKRKSD